MSVLDLKKKSSSPTCASKFARGLLYNKCKQLTVIRVMSLTVSYLLNPPADIQAGNLLTSRKQSFPVKCSSDDRTKYYGALHNAIEEAKYQLGNELTAWKDAVEKAELSKETAKTLKYDADEGDEEDEP